MMGRDREERRRPELGLGQTEVIGAALTAIPEEVGRALIRTAISPNLKERRDCSAAVFSPLGNLLAQAAHIPIHLGSLLDFAKYLASIDTLSEGDIYICNEPYSYSGSHLNDIAVLAPVFCRRELIGFIGNIGHHPDVGGRTPGSEAPDSREIFEEGIRIPPIKLSDGGALREDVVALVCANSRLNETMRADLGSQISACKVGVRRLQEIASRYGVANLRVAADEWLAYGGMRFRAACARHSGLSFSFAETLFDQEREIRNGLYGSVNVREDGVLVDLRNCIPQVPSGVNAPLGATRAVVYYVIKSALDPGCPSNQGYFDQVELLTQRSTIVHAVEPAAVSHRIATCQKLADALMRGFAEAGVEEAVAGCHGASLLILSGQNSEGSFVNYEAFAGGLGGSKMGPGLSGMMGHTTNSSNLPIEVMEHYYPFRVREYALRERSGGRGLHSGGAGVVREFEVLEPRILLTTALMDAHEGPPGVRGGLRGARARCFVRRRESTEAEELPPRASGLVLGVGDVVRLETAGGGGWGSWADRIE